MAKDFSKSTIAFVLPTHLKGVSVGWGNGYVAVPKEHPFFGMDYDDIHNRFDISVHGGLTFAGASIKGQPESTNGMWIIGFDTAHCDDSLDNWPNAAAVMNEALSLKDQIDNPKISEEGKAQDIRDAAPDLLEACIQAIQVIPTDHGAYKTVSAAIKKALKNQ